MDGLLFWIRPDSAKVMLYVNFGFIHYSYYVLLSEFRRALVNMKMYLVKLGLCRSLPAELGFFRAMQNGFRIKFVNLNWRRD